MTTKDDLKVWILEALHRFGGKAWLIDVAEFVWDNHEAELKQNRNLFFRWQYVMRWAATELRKEGLMKDNKRTEPWELTSKGQDKFQ